MGDMYYLWLYITDPTYEGNQETPPGAGWRYLFLDEGNGWEDGTSSTAQLSNKIGGLVDQGDVEMVSGCAPCEI